MLEYPYSLCLINFICSKRLSHVAIASCVFSSHNTYDTVHHYLFTSLIFPLNCELIEGRDCFFCLCIPIPLQCQVFSNHKIQLPTREFYLVTSQISANQFIYTGLISPSYPLYKFKTFFLINQESPSLPNQSFRDIPNSCLSFITQTSPIDSTSKLHSQFTYISLLPLSVYPGHLHLLPGALPTTFYLDACFYFLPLQSIIHREAIIISKIQI